MPKVREYSRKLGRSAPESRSRWMRSTITTSAPSSAGSTRSKTSTGQLDVSDGMRVRGPAKRTRAPRAVSSHAFDRATRLWVTSPQMVTVSPSMRPLARRMVKASSSAWVGCSWVPSPALTMPQRTRDER